MLSTHLPPPTGGIRPETLPRMGREAGRESNRRSEESDPGPNYGPLGTGLPDGLGNPMPGTVGPDPGMAEWSPVDPGAGDWGSEDPTNADHVNHEAATHAANLLAPVWPDASENLLHFLRNSGNDKEMDLDSYLADESDIRTHIEDHEQAIANTAMKRAQQSGIAGPMTFPVQTGWPGVTAETKNWFYATGSGNYSMNGQVTVYPPDASKATTIDLPGPFSPTITDEQLAELHRAGLAKEYTFHGSTQRQVTGP